jgi:hypothetical protein
VAAVQYLGSKGFFAAYDARPEEQLSPASAAAWAETAALLLENRPYDANARARRLPPDTPEHGADSITVSQFCDTLAAHLQGADRQPAIATAIMQLGFAAEQTLDRARCCQLIYALVQQAGV